MGCTSSPKESERNSQEKQKSQIEPEKNHPEESKKQQKEPENNPMTEEKIKKIESERNPKTEEIKEKKESERNPKTEEKIEKKDEDIKNGEEEEEEEETEKEPENLFYCFNKEEISLIKELKEKEDQDIRNGVEEQKDELKTLYKKVEINIIGNEKNFTDYIVLYLPNNFNQLNSVKYEYTPMFTKISLGLKRCLNNINYAKKIIF